MKKVSKFLVVAALLLLTTIPASAEMVSFGLSAGTSTTNFSIKGYDNAISNSTGFQAGASLTFQLPVISITPEAWYSQSKFTVLDPSIMGGYGKVTSRAVDMPIVAGLSLLKIITIELGPSFSLYDKAKAEFLTGDDADLGHVRSAVGYVAGLKVILAKKIILGARFNGQFGGRENDFGGYSTYKVHNYSYAFSLGFKL